MFILELYFRCFLCTLLSFEVCLLLKTKHSSKDILWKLTDGGIVLLSGTVEVAASHSDTVLSTFQLRL